MRDVMPLSAIDRVQISHPLQKLGGGAPGVDGFRLARHQTASNCKVFGESHEEQP